MTDMWVYRLDIIALPDPTNGVPDFTGFEVVTTDDKKIGKIEEATEMAEKSWIIVDTGPWILGKKKRMVPAGVIEPIDPDQHQVRIALTKDEIKEAPDYDGVRRHEAFYQGTLEDYYRKYIPARR